MFYISSYIGHTLGDFIMALVSVDCLVIFIFYEIVWHKFLDPQAPDKSFKMMAILARDENSNLPTI